MTTTAAGKPAGRRLASLVLLGRAGWGSLLVLRPAAGLRLLGGPEPSGSARPIVRTLGARHLAQVALEVTRGPAWRRLGTAVDALHATSAVAFAVVDPSWRRAALTDATIAGLFAATGLRAGGATA